MYLLDDQSERMAQNHFAQTDLAVRFVQTDLAVRFVHSD